MKYTFIFVLALVLVSSVAFAQDAFTPNLLKLSAASEVTYDFDGTDLDISYELSGHDGTVVFVVMTKGKGEEIGIVQNGNLGWHLVNKVDTTVYFSAPEPVGTGTNTITWNGRDLDNNVVGSDTYQYFLWAYDHASQKLPAAGLVGFNWLEKGKIWTVNEDGTPRTQPLLVNVPNGVYSAEEVTSCPVYRWNIGDPPFDETKLEQTLIGAYTHYTGGSLDPDDYSKFYYLTVNTTTATCFVQKWSWVPDDVAEQDFDWGEEEGSTTYSIFSPYGYLMGAVALPTGRILMAGEFNHWTDLSAASGIYRLDMDTGEIIDHLDLWEYFANESIDDETGESSWSTDGPFHAIIRDGDNKMLLNSTWSGKEVMVVNPWAESEEVEDFVYWKSDSGDGFMDKLTEESPSQMSYIRTMDASGFVSEGTYDMGNLSFDLLAPDGTGIGFFAYLNETAASKPPGYYLDNDTPYDGMYSPNGSTVAEGDERASGGWWWIGHDSISGTISAGGTGVADASPAAFAVEQNSPNPCNPTTTIGFTIDKAGNVKIDVYNVAGQKVDTIVNNHMDAGKHSVVWDGSDFSAGVYFYTVKSGDFSRTMKMTLLK